MKEYMLNQRQSYGAIRSVFLREQYQITCRNVYMYKYIRNRNIRAFVVGFQSFISVFLIKCNTNRFPAKPLLCIPQIRAIFFFCFFLQIFLFTVSFFSTKHRTFRNFFAFFSSIKSKIITSCTH